MSVTSRLSTLPSIAVSIRLMRLLDNRRIALLVGLCPPEQFFDQIALFRDSGFAQFARASVEARERLVCERRRDLFRDAF